MYKRQSLYNTKYMEYTLDENPLRSELCKKSIVMQDGVVTVFDEPGLGVEPVSYTHLDVYKRQLRRSS